MKIEVLNDACTGKPEAYFAKGWHDKSEFAEAVKRETGLKIRIHLIRHIVARLVPGDEGFNFFESSRGRGAFKATYIEIIS